MNFNWLKNLFHKKIKDSVGITNINSELTYVPQMNELDKESRRIVMDQYRGLTKDNHREKILNYSYDLAQKSYKEIDDLTRAMMKYEAQYEEYRDDRKNEKKKEMVMATDYHLALLSVAEYNSIIDNVFNIRAELTLRLLALDLFIKKEKIEYKFKGIISRRQDVEYRKLLEELEEERGRLLTLITCNDHIYLAVKHNINAKAMLEEKQEIFYLVDQKLNNGEKNIQKLVMDKLRTTGEHLTRCIKITGLKEEFEKDLKEKLVPKIKKSNNIDYDDIISDMIFSCNWLYFLDKVDFNKIKEVYKLLGVYYHKYEAYRLEHFHDYEKYIEEMEELVKMCETTPPRKWDNKYIYEKTSYYIDEVYGYIRLFDKTNSLDSDLLCKDYDASIDEENRKKLVELFYKLSLFNFSVMDKDEDNHNKINQRKYVYPYSTQKSYHEFSDFRLSYIFDLLTRVSEMYRHQMKIGVWDFTIDQIFDKDYNTALKQIYEKDLKKQLESLEFCSTVIKDCLSMINGKPLDTEVGFKAYRSNICKDLKVYIRTIGNAYAPSIIRFDVPCESKDNYVFDVIEIKTATDEEVYYVMKMFGVDPDKRAMTISDTTVEGNYLKWLQEIQTIELEKRYDSRIMVFPKSIKISFDDMGRAFLPQHTESDKVGLNSTIENVFVSTKDQFDYVHDICRMQLAPEYRTVKKRIVHAGESDTYEEPNYKSSTGRNLKRIFMTEELYKTIKEKDYYDISLKAKIVVIPNIEHYSDITKYLNKELEKEEQIYRQSLEEMQKSSTK